MNAFGLVAALEPQEVWLNQRVKPSGFAMRRGTDEWENWHCFRGLGVGGRAGAVTIGFGKASEPLDEALAVEVDVAEFSIEAAEHLHLRLGLAIEEARRNVD